jgi:hypothetical protein
LGFARTHHQGICDELRCHRRAYRPANYPPREQVASRCLDMREVGDPFAVGCRRFEAAFEHVGSDGGAPAAHPDRGGARRHRGRALRPCRRINRSIRSYRTRCSASAGRTTRRGSHRSQGAGTYLRARLLMVPATVTAGRAQADAVITVKREHWCGREDSNVGDLIG